MIKKLGIAPKLRQNRFKYGATAVVLAKGQRIESSRDFDATRPCGRWMHWNNSKFIFGLGPATRICVALRATDMHEVLK